MEREFDDRTLIKKGPWSKEEDEVLLKHVSKYGPRDWSSIRSKRLLHRTGKSCRLRWVNKLRPNLKSGCKFSAEEERVVIELQGQFGNKWAKIATHLEGRTDNDVKNFWSSRRKRLERMLQKKSSPSKTHKNKGKTPLDNINQVLIQEDPLCCSNKPEETLCCNYLPYTFASYMGNTEDVFKMVNIPDLTIPNHQNLESELNSVDVAAPLPMVPSFESSTTEYTFPQLPAPQMEFPLFPEPHDLVPEAIDPTNFIDDVFGQKKCGTSLPSLGLERSSQSKSPSGFFEDFPTEIFEYFDNVPTSSEL